MCIIKTSKCLTLRTNKRSNRVYLTLIRTKRPLFSLRIIKILGDNMRIENVDKLGVNLNNH